VVCGCTAGASAAGLTASPPGEELPLGELDDPVEVVSPEAMFMLDVVVPLADTVTVPVISDP
jgi:hypothetical protein